MFYNHELGPCFTNQGLAESMFYKTWTQSMFFESSPCFSSPVHVFRIQSSPCFTTCLLVYCYYLFLSSVSSKFVVQVTVEFSIK